MSEDDAVEIGIERACEAVLALPMGQRAWDKKEYMIAETAARTAVNAYREPTEADVERVAQWFWSMRGHRKLFPGMYRFDSWETLIINAKNGAPYAVTFLTECREDARAAIAAMQGERK